jgi:hypothetical protein
VGALVDRRAGQKGGMTMRVLVIAAAIAALSATPIGSAALSAPAASCGAGLAAGVTGCIEWKMKASKYSDLIAKALKGDNEAARVLGDFNDMREDATDRDPGRKWWLLAAERGDCHAIEAMLDRATEAGRRAEATKWRTRARWNKCPANRPLLR